MIQSGLHFSLFLLFALSKNTTVCPLPVVARQEGLKCIFLFCSILFMWEYQLFQTSIYSRQSSDNNHYNDNQSLYPLWSGHVLKTNPKKKQKTKLMVWCDVPSPLAWDCDVPSLIRKDDSWQKRSSRRRPAFTSWSGKPPTTCALTSEKPADATMSNHTWDPSNPHCCWSNLAIENFARRAITCWCNWCVPCGDIVMGPKSKGGKAALKEEWCLCPSSGLLYHQVYDVNDEGT